MSHYDEETDLRIASELLPTFIEGVPTLFKRTFRKDCSEFMDSVFIDLTGIDLDDECTEEGEAEELLS